MKQYDRKIEILRAFAIFSVVCAHTAVVNEASPISSVLAQRILSYIAIMGVPIFFFIAGYFHSLSKDNFLTFAKKKLIQIVVPSLFCFTFLWLYVALRKGGLDIKTWLSFVTGETSTAYYVVCLLMLYLLSFLVRKYKVFSIIGIAISITWFTISGSLLASAVDGLFLSTYHNIFYWLGYFSLGMLVGNTNCLDKLFKMAKKWLPLLLVASVAICFGLYYFRIYPTYFSGYAFALTLLWGITIIGIAALDVYKSGGVVEKVGNYSFTIYLTHQFFSGLIIHVTEKVDCFLTVLIRPIVNIAIVMLLIYLYKYLNRLLNGRLCFLSYLVGIKEKKGESYGKV